ncbi:MAG: phosphate ABC transporter substrate-binding protein [Bacteroidota bacterium]
MKKILNSLFILLLILNSCSTNQLQVATIRIKGSDTMLNLTSLLAEEYMKENPGVSIYVEGGGSASGIRALLRGDVEICTASRTLISDEIKLFADQYGSVGVSYLIAKDGLSIYLNPENRVDEISTQQLKDIYLCKIINWKEIGGADMPIIPISRTPNSGTYLYFKEHILGGSDYCSNILIVPTTKNVIETVSEKKNAIGYGGIGFKKQVTVAKINDIEPTEENVRNDIYPITRYLHFYTIHPATGIVKDFIDWVISPDGQREIKEAGFIPLFEISN